MGLTRSRNEAAIIAGVEGWERAADGGQLLGLDQGVIVGSGRLKVLSVRLRLAKMRGK